MLRREREFPVGENFHDRSSVFPRSGRSLRVEWKENQSLHAPLWGQSRERFPSATGARQPPSSRGSGTPHVVGPRGGGANSVRSQMDGTCSGILHRPLQEITGL